MLGSTSLGPHLVVATSGTQTQSAQLLVVAPVTPAAAPLPITGTNAIGYLFGAIALVVLGSTLVLSSRHRRRRRVV
jgi:LPXTG-motif cell wall-anchored protein